MKIALCVIATGRYLEFVEPLWLSAQQFFLPLHERTLFVFTDQPHSIPAEGVAVAIKHEPWPGPTLHRYASLLQAKERLLPFDYMFMTDADMRFVGRVDEEIFGAITATLHPGFYQVPPNAFTYERREVSTAFISDASGSRYFCGGFQGGAAATYLEAVAELGRRIEQDSERGITAVWHDESHWNCYLAERTPDVILSPSYCFPEGWGLPFEPKLLALHKDHSAYRQ